jgi:integrase
MPSNQSSPATVPVSPTNRAFCRRRVPSAGRRAARGRVVRQSQNPTPAASMKTLPATSRLSPASNARKNSARSRAHIIAWRDELAAVPSGIASRHWYRCSNICEKSAAPTTRSKALNGRRRKAAKARRRRSDHQARELLGAPDKDTIKSKRDRVILSTLLFHALRPEELCKLKVKDIQHARKGVPHLKLYGKGGKTRYVPRHPAPTP